MLLDLAQFGRISNLHTHEVGSVINCSLRVLLAVECATCFFSLHSIFLFTRPHPCLHLLFIRTTGALPSPSRSAVHFSILAILNIFVGIAFVVSQVHAMGYRSYDHLYWSNAREPICEKNKTHHLNLIFSVFETSQRSGRLIKGYSIMR